MTPEELEHLVSSYLKHLEHCRVPVPTTREEARSSDEEYQRRMDTDENFEAWEELDYLCHHEPEPALAVILQLVNRCHGDDLGSVGAGPLETLVCKHATLFADRIEHLIRTDDRFFEAYRMVNMGGVPLSLQRRLNGILVERGVPSESILEFPETYDFDTDA